MGLASIYTAEFNEMFDDGKFHGGKTNNTIHVVDTWTDGTTVVESYFSPTDDAKANAVFKLIDNATTTLDIQMFFLTDQEIADKIIAAHNRNVTVRVIIDATGGGSAHSKTTALCDAGIQVKTENWGAKQHNKLGVADSGVAGSGTVVVGSMNWTAAGDASNDENTIYVKNDAFAADFQADFNAKWADLAQVAACTRIAAEGNASSVCTNDNCQTQCVSGACCDGADNDHDNTVDALDNQCTDQNPLGPDSACEPDSGNPGAGDYGNGEISVFTNQQIHDTLNFVNGATVAELEACGGISSSETSKLVSGRPYSGIGTIGSDESKGAVPGHIDSVSFITDRANDNDLVHLRNCAPVTNECDVIEGTGPNCIDGLDNDSDGFIDAADFDCRPVLGLESEDTQARCTDGADNDGDGFIDAVDFDCGPVLGL